MLVKHHLKLNFLISRRDTWSIKTIKLPTVIVLLDVRAWHRVNSPLKVVVLHQTLECFPQGSSLGQFLPSCSPSLASHFSCLQLTCPPPLDSPFISSSTLYPAVTSSMFPNPSLFYFFFYFSLLGFSSSTRRSFNLQTGMFGTDTTVLLTVLKPEIICAAATQLINEWSKTRLKTFTAAAAAQIKHTFTVQVLFRALISVIIISEL